jgi:hypothetical protein
MIQALNFIHRKALNHGDREKAHSASIFAIIYDSCRYLEALVVFK